MQKTKDKKIPHYSLAETKKENSLKTSEDAEKGQMLHAALQWASAIGSLQWGSPSKHKRGMQRELKGFEVTVLLNIVQKLVNTNAWVARAKQASENENSLRRNKLFL